MHGNLSVQKFPFKMEGSADKCAHAIGNMRLNTRELCFAKKLKSAEYGHEMLRQYISLPLLLPSLLLSVSPQIIQL